MQPGSQIHSPLLALPAELRDRIYAFVFDGIEEEVPRKSTTRSVTRVLALLRTCKQIKYEAAGYVYGPVPARFDLHADWIRLTGQGLSTEDNKPSPDWTIATHLNKILPHVTHLDCSDHGVLVLLRARSLHAFSLQLTMYTNSSRSYDRAKGKIHQLTAIPHNGHAFLAPLYNDIVTLRSGFSSLTTVTVAVSPWTSLPRGEKNRQWRWLLIRVLGRGVPGRGEIWPSLRDVRVLAETEGHRYRRRGVGDDMWCECYTGAGPDALPFD